MRLDSAVGGYMPEYIINKYKEKNAYWKHDGNPLRPHVQLTSGKHSGVFFNSDDVLNDFLFLNVIVHKLLAIAAGKKFSTKAIQKAIGPAMGAINLAHHMGGVVSNENGIFCPSGYAEKSSDEAGNKIMIFNRTKVFAGERLMLGEDVITTKKTVELTMDAIDRHNAETLEYVFTLINRSEFTHVRDREIIALYHEYHPNYEPEDCPYCKMGSVALRAKEGNNWQLLHQHYPIH
jgi:orotate phosphoribosyltransferase